MTSPAHLNNFKSSVNKHLKYYVKPKIVELLHQIVELLQYLRFISKNFSLTYITSIFAL